VPDKPKILVYLEQMETFNALPYSGGIMNQPYILIGELKQCSDIRSLFEALMRSQQKQAGSEE